MEKTYVVTSIHLHEDSEITAKSLYGANDDTFIVRFDYESTIYMTTLQATMLVNRINAAINRH